MSQQDISRKKESFLRLIDRGRIHDAIRGLRRMSERQMAWEITDEISRAESAYRYMLRYAMDGVDDPQRRSIYDRIVGRLIVVFDRLSRNAVMADDPRLYYNVARTLPTADLPAVLDGYKRLISMSDAFTAAMSDGVQAVTPADLEAAARDMFNAIWVTYPMSDDDREAVMAFLNAESVPVYVKRLVVSAVMLGNLAFFDDVRFAILADVYSSGSDDRLSLQALVGLLLSLFVNRRRRMSEAVVNRMASLKEIPTWRNDLRTAFIEFIRTRDTERITRKMTDEVVPEMLKMRPEITKKLGDKTKYIDMTDFEENPEWQELLDKSGIADKLKELSEIQEEGGDVFMGTFAHLKGFPFFYDISNWFLPFHPDHSTVGRIGEGADVIAAMIDKSPFLCDGDKYSFILAVSGVPVAQRDMMLSQLKAYNVNAAEIQNASLDLTPDRRRNIVNKYVQDLYRFFRLFRRKGDFEDPFADEINLTDVALLADQFDDGDTLRLIGEFYFKHKYCQEALGVFRRLENLTFPDAQLYQKMGYCEQHAGNIAEALRYYEQAELLNARSSWTIKRIAACQRLLGNVDKALDYYRRLDEMVPDRYSTVVALGDCLLEKGDYDGAIKQYFKAVYLEEDNPRAWRPLSWALMMTGDLDRSRQYLDRAIATSAEPVDYLNLGHLYLLAHDSQNAVNSYKMNIATDPEGVKAFIEHMKADADSLVKAGLNRDVIELAIDAVLYALDDE